MRKVLFESRKFKLVQDATAKGRRFYKIVLTSYYSYEETEAIRNLVDPLRNKSGNQGTSWKYRNRKDAEQHYTMLLMGWA